jgi:hypothetical protein
MKQGFEVEIDFTSKRVQNQVENKRPKSAIVQNSSPSFSDNLVTKSFRNPSFAGSNQKNSEKEIMRINTEELPQVSNLRILNLKKENNEEKVFEEENRVEIEINGMNKEDSFKAKEDAPAITKQKDEYIEMETKSNYSSLMKPHSILNRHLRYKKVRRLRKQNKQKRRQNQNQNATEIILKNQNPQNNENEEEVEKMNMIIQDLEQRQIQVNQSNVKSFESQANMIDVSTIRNFLNFHGMMFLEEDLELVMYCLGSAHGIVDREAFKRFFYSPLWD